MIRIASRPKSATPAWHEGFLKMLPAIRLHARIAFRHLSGEAKAECVQNCIANAMIAYLRLHELGKIDLAYAGPLARYAVAQTKGFRVVGGHLAIRDVMSGYCQKRKHVTVERLDKFDEDEGTWQEAVVQDTRSSPVPDVVAFRCDFSQWLHDLPHRNRRIAEFLALGNRTGEAAHKFGVSEGRVSQLRREFQGSWEKFQGEVPEPTSATSDPV